MIFELCPYGIWNETIFNEKYVGQNLNFVPMGFETLTLWSMCKRITNLNFVPMGFETSHSEQLHTQNKLFELCPYGIWNNFFKLFNR